MMRLVVRPGEARTVGEVLARYHAPESAVAEGRVFVGDRRVDDAALPVEDGDEIVVMPGREAPSGVKILSEYRGLYAVSKPPGLPTEPDRSGTASLVHAVAEMLGAPVEEFHATTRLDAQVSGIVVVSRGPHAAARAVGLRASGSLGRRYLALASSPVEPSAGKWDAPVGKSSRGEPALRGRDARPATTHYAMVALAPLLATAASPSLLAIEPVTGRTHQIRLHAAEAGAPLLGDVKHGGLRRVVLADGRAVVAPRVALHAARVQAFEKRVAVWTVTAPFPDDLAALWATLGGSPAAPEQALALPALYAR